MSIKIAVLKTGEQVISDINEAFYEEKFRGYLLKNPQVVSINKQSSFLSEDKTNEDSIEIILSPWIPLSSDTEMLIPPDFVVSLVDPIETLEKIYIQKVGENND